MMNEANSAQCINHYSRTQNKHYPTTEGFSDIIMKWTPLWLACLNASHKPDFMVITPVVPYFAYLFMSFILQLARIVILRVH